MRYYIDKRNVWVRNVISPAGALLTWINLYPNIISNHMPSEVCDEITASSLKYGNLYKIIL